MEPLTMGEPVVSTGPAVKSPPTSPALLAAEKAPAFGSGAVLRLGIAAVLLLAASLKIYQLVTEPGLRVHSISRWLQVAQVEYEFLLALWLLSGFWPRHCRATCLATFAVFSGYSLYLASSGAASCGCFGRVHVNPWWSFALDAAVVVLLWRWKPSLVNRGSRSRAGRIRAASVTASLLLVATVGSVGVIVLASPPAPAGPDSFADETLIVLEPGGWIGERFPLIPYIDIGERFSEGDWTVVLIHYNCPKCRLAVPKYERLARELGDEHKPAQIAFIEVPPYGPMEHDPGSPCQRGKLSDGKEWFVTTPTVLKLADGRVVAATLEE
jgi:hypothetical protein